MTEIMISIRPQWVQKILSGEKTIEVRKTAPQAPFKAYVYCTLGDYLLQMPDKTYRIYSKKGFGSYEPDFAKHKLNGKVVAEFVCDEVEKFAYWFDKEYGGYILHTPCVGLVPEELLKESCLGRTELAEYSKHKLIYALRISDLKIYDEPLELGDFGLARPAQSWQYVRRGEDENYKD